MGVCRGEPEGHKKPDENCIWCPQGKLGFVNHSIQAQMHKAKRGDNEYSVKGEDHHDFPNIQTCVHLKALPKRPVVG